MFPNQIRQSIIRPALEVCSMWSESAEVLVFGTGMVETGYQYITQIGEPRNGGLGFWQMEPSDYKDLLTWFRRNTESKLLERILDACYYISTPVDPNVLAHNIKYACLMCRSHYLRIREPIPDAQDAQALAKYHVKYYNGNGLGKADVQKNTKIFQGIIDEKGG